MTGGPTTRRHAPTEKNSGYRPEWNALSEISQLTQDTFQGIGMQLE